VTTATNLTLCFTAAALIWCDGSRTVAPKRQLLDDLISGKAGTGSDLSVSPYYVGMSLSWADAHNETAFRVLRSSTGPTGAFAAIATTAPNVTQYSDTAISPSSEYCYRIETLQKTRVGMRRGTARRSCCGLRTKSPRSRRTRRAIA